MHSSKLTVPGELKAKRLSLACGALHNLAAFLLTSLLSCHPCIKYTNFLSFPASLGYFLCLECSPLHLFFCLFGPSSASSPPQDGPGPSLSPILPSPSTSSWSHFCNSLQIITLLKTNHFCSCRSATSWACHGGTLTMRLTVAPS